MAENKTVEYMCTYCGTKAIRNTKSGRPFPSTCPKRPKRAGAGQPHRWVINRKW